MNSLLSTRDARRLAKAVLITALCCVFWGCNRAPDTARQPPAVVAKPVRVIAVGDQSGPVVLRVNGVVAPRDEARLAFKVPGVVRAVHVDEGDAFRRGKLLAELSSDEVDAQVTEAIERAAKADRDLDRARNLFARGLVAEQVVQDANTGADVARAQLKAARFNQAHAQLVASDDGIVLRRVSEPGETVAAGATIVTVSRRGRGWVLKAGVPDRVALQLHKGDPAAVAIDARSDESFKGHVAQIAATSDAGTGTFNVEILLDNPPADIAAGLVAHADVTLKTRPHPASSLSVPIGALLEINNGSAHVFVLQDGGKTVRRRDVRVGAPGGETVTVLSGLESGSRVVSEGAVWLVDGDAVELVP